MLWGALLWLTRLSAFADQEVGLTWNPSPNTNVAGYKVYFGGASRTYTNSLTLGIVTNVTISGLSEGATYYFGATTVDASGVESDFSNEATYDIPGTVSNQPPVVTPSPGGSQPPTLNAIANLVVYQNAGLQTVPLAGITSGSTNPLLVSAVSSNPGIIPAPTVNYVSPDSAGTLTFAPVANAVGTATLTVTVDDSDASHSPASQTFTVTVVPDPNVNQPPTLDAIANVAVSQNAAAQTLTLTGITSGSSTENQILKVSVSSSNPRVLPTPVIRYTSPANTALLTFKPTVNVTGTATITVTVKDGGKSNNIVRHSFTVSVQPNQVPTLNPLANVTVTQNAAAQTISLTGITSGSPTERQTLRVSASSSNPRLVPAPMIRYTSPASNALLTFKPALHVTGVATITVTVNDGSSRNNIIRRSFKVTVTAAANNKLVSTNQPVNFNPAATLTTLASAPGQFGFQVAGVAGGKYVVQATADLIHWTSVETNTAPFTFQDDTAHETSHRFYRAYYVP
jgi:fibronectin type 3 domain-containing protein